MKDEYVRVYCDTNIFSRPFDDAAQPRIHLEAVACLKIFTLAERKEILIASSEILVYEIRHSAIEKQISITPFLKLCAVQIPLTEIIRNRAEKLARLNISPRDALHIASAIDKKIPFFITCDDALVKKHVDVSQEKITVVNPVNFITHHYANSHKK